MTLEPPTIAHLKGHGNPTLIGAAAERYVMRQLLRRQMIAALAPTGVPAAFLFALVIFSAPGLCAAAPEKNETPRHYCARVGNDDLLRSPPSSLASAIRRLFKASGTYALETTYYRCAGGDLLLCNVGANLPCGKANRSTTLPAATDWCQSNPNSDFIPMAVTGHDTLYVWRCIGVIAKPVGKIGEVDKRGFFTRYWKEVR